MRNLFSPALVGLAMTMLSLASSPVLAGPVVFDQPANYLNAWTSEDYTGGGSTFRTFDDFRLGAPAAIGGLRWTGAYVDLDDLVYPTPDSTAFTFRFHADAAGTPGALLSEQSVAWAQVTATLLGFAGYGNLNARVFGFTASLPVAFAAAADTNYWLSISSLAPADNVVFAWVAGEAADPVLPQLVDGSFQMVNGVTQFKGRDRAFALEAVPEPATLLLLAAGAVAAARRRR